MANDNGSVGLRIDTTTLVGSAALLVAVGFAIGIGAYAVYNNIGKQKPIAVLEFRGERPVLVEIYGTRNIIGALKKLGGEVIVGRYVGVPTSVGSSTWHTCLVVRAKRNGSAMLTGECSHSGEPTTFEVWKASDSDIGAEIIAKRIKDYRDRMNPPAR